jgi:thioredoxin-related protein
MIILFLIANISLSGDVWSQQRNADKESQNIDWLEFEKALSMAEDDSMKVMLFMEADWCTLCKKMKKEVFPNPEIQATLKEKFHSVRINIESEDTIVFRGVEQSKKELSKDFGLYATPTFIFLSSDKSVIGNKPGYMDKNEFLELLQFVANGDYKEAGL